MYLEEAVAAFYSGCFLAATVMLGVAAEAEFLRLIDVANANGTIRKSFDQAKKERFIRAKIEAFRKGLAPHLKTLSNAATEDLDINLNAVQSIIRISRNEAGHPSGAGPPSREQVYVNLQLFAPYADQVGRLRKELASVGSLQRCRSAGLARKAAAISTWWTMAPRASWKLHSKPMAQKPSTMLSSAIPR
jgi:hypothetical protein